MRPVFLETTVTVSVCAAPVKLLQVPCRLAVFAPLTLVRSGAPMTFQL